MAQTRLRVRYAETDAMGVVYHTNYIVWFEVGRGEYSRQQGADYREWEKLGLFLPVIEVTCRYHAPAHYAEEAIVYTWVEEARSRGVTFGYAVHMAQTGQELATGRTVHICVNGQGKPTQIPASWRAALFSAAPSAPRT